MRYTRPNTSDIIDKPTTGLRAVSTVNAARGDTGADTDGPCIGP